jgi:lambda repressor-like predicted transcriptional regulator
LCEAELRRQGFSASHVTWGGDQNATDGGIDVRVALPPGSVIQGFVPRAASGFQVKKQDMPPAEIVAEMCPKGAIRASIRNLVQDSGAYVLVSSEGSTSDSALNNRRDAMKQALAELPNAGMLALDFYDRTRIATWLRSHEGLIPWVRGLIGKAAHSPGNRCRDPGCNQQTGYG